MGRRRKGQRSCFRFANTFGYVFEIYYDTVHYRAESAERPVLNNLAQRHHARGACPCRLDHLNLLASDVREFKTFMEICLGSRVTEMIQLDNAHIGGC